MISKRIRALAVVGLAAGLAFGGVRVGSAQFGGIAGRNGRVGANDAQLSYSGGPSFLAVETPGKDGLKVYDVEEGTWSEYRAPKGVRVRPSSGFHYIAAMPEGPKITQLAAYSEVSKTWVTLELPEPVEGELWGPLIGPAGPVYVAGRRAIAFSAPASKWAVLELPEGVKPQPIGGAKVVTVLHGDRLHIFNPKFGRWDDSGDKPK
jgi:hypothetical protein